MAEPRLATGRDADRPVIRLGVTDWTGARLNVAIAEHVIERRLGYPVEAVEVTDIQGMLDDLSRGDLDAVLEVWPSSLDESGRATIDAGRVAELGLLGIEGRSGWYVPRSVAEGDLAVTGWEALADPAVARAFATPGTSPLGRFLGTNPDDDELDHELIEALDLPFEVQYSGSPANTTAEVDEAVSAGQPVLLYWWSPTALVARHDLVPVALPDRTEECLSAFRAGGLLACDYAVDPLIKLGAPDLADRAPEVNDLLTAFQLTIEDQLAMIDRVENDGLPLDQVADAWIEANRERWETWLG